MFQTPLHASIKFKIFKLLQKLPKYSQEIIFAFLYKYFFAQQWCDALERDCYQLLLSELRVKLPDLVHNILLCRTS